MAVLEDQGVAPPENQAPVIQTGVVPPTPGAQSGVAGVQLDYDPNFKHIVQNVISPTTEGNKKTADILNTRAKESEVEDPNRSMQLGKMMISLLQGRVGEAYKWYNGGGIKYEEGRDVNNNPVWVGVSERGKTTDYKDWSTGKPLTDQQKKELFARGGVTTESDIRAERSADWQSALSAKTNANKGFESQLIAARKSAMAAANEGSASNKNIDQEIGLALKLKHVVNTMANMDPKQRQVIMGYANRYRTNSENLRRSAEATGGVSLGDQTQVGGGVSGGPAIPGRPNASLSSGQTASTSGSQSNAAATGRENTIQEQQNLQNAIMEASLGSIKTPQEFAEFMRLIDLNQANNASNQNIPEDAQPPGWRKIAPADVFTGGVDTLLENRYSQQANNALIAAYNNELYKAQKEMATTGKVISTQEVLDRFKNSDISIGAINYAKDKIYKMTGRGEPLKKGDLIYRKSGKIEAHEE